MKSAIRLCDFWAIFTEEQTDTALVVTGSLKPFTMLDQVKTIRAIFPRQSGAKGSWTTNCYWREDTPKA